MVFQGFSFFAMALVSVGVIAYHFYKNREAYFYDNPHTYNIYNYNNELQYKSSDDNNTRKRKVAKDDTCSICMESVHSSALSLPKDAPSSAISLPCNHLFHTECVKAWFDMNKTCPNCRALAPTSM
jgi:hypothetical protein